MHGRKIYSVLIVLSLAWPCSSSRADDTAATTRRTVSPQAWKYPPEFDDAAVETFKTVDGRQLKIYIFNPSDHDALPDAALPTAVFFFGGGWNSGTPHQFEQQCRYLASRGMIAMTADYRVRTRHGTNADACVADGKSAIRWVRQNAQRLRVDPNRILAGGGSAGGHVAACAGIVPGFEDGDKSISSRPNAMALFNPGLVLAVVEGEDVVSQEKEDSFRPRLGTNPEWISPYHQLTPDVPPTIILHGMSDTTVSYRSVELFAKKAKSAGGTIRLIGYQGQEHGFFNCGRGQNRMVVATMKELDRFLVDLGYLEGSPAIDDWMAKQTAASRD